MITFSQITAEFFQKSFRKTGSNFLGTNLIDHEPDSETDTSRPLKYSVIPIAAGDVRETLSEPRKKELSASILESVRP